jgi:phosphatidylinositol glycan class B
MQHEFPAGGDNDRAVTRVLWRSLALVAAVTILTAYFSDLYYFPDEHYQVLEFMSNKLGVTAAADMPWEYFARIRPWMQPFLYSLIARPLLFAGVKDLFVVTFILRLATGFLSLAALALFAKETLAGIEGRQEKLAFARYLPLFGFLPYLFVRTASETISAAFFTLGLALVMRRRSLGRVLCAGLLCGLAFECRYQSAILILGLSAWLIFVARLRGVALAAFTAATLAPVGLGAMIDRWGYGAWSFPPWLYFKANILDGVAAKSFGADPVFAYLYMIPANIFLPICIVLMVSMIAMWVRNPRHVVTWVTVPFVVIHALVAHKEPRFLFPLAIVATAFPVLGFSPLLPRGRAWAARAWAWHRSAAAKFVTASSVLAMLFLAVYPFGIRPHMPMAKYVYRHFPGGLTAYSFDAEPFTSYPMYRAVPFRSEKLGNTSALEAHLTRGPVYLFSNTPTLPNDAVPAGTRAEILYSEFPLAGFGYDALGTRYLHAFAAFAAREAWLKLPPLYWVTLFRVERASPAIRS